MAKKVKAELVASSASKLSKKINNSKDFLLLVMGDKDLEAFSLNEFSDEIIAIYLYHNSEVKEKVLHNLKVLESNDEFKNINPNINLN